MELQVNLGQLLVGTLIAVVGWFIRREITSVHDRLDKTEERFNERLDKTEEAVFTLSGNVQKLIGAFHIK